ncbi:unconventional myosin-VIIb-like [Leuresthes tenuis]|uniref:unconventional myosin-VIIb-like n=1 Tax=Leuresthes tenuis TaxID=355514 RepID=UPI003B511F47
MLRKGEWVWVDSDIGLPIGARVKETPSGRRLLVDDEGNEQTLFLEQEASLKIMHPTSVEGVDDMIKLGDMTEAALLRNLLLRYKQGSIYTYTGSVLVAMNPYQEYPIYSGEQMKLYRGRKLGQLPPHIFAIAESCYFNMTRQLKNQCCIISGESGAGKTESTKLILQYLAAISGELSQQQVETQILESNPILEAFGNAKTVRNDNSSRFGKYLEIFFNKDGVIEGARVEQYLLEKSRVCHQSLEERNYHIFYCMLAGISQEEKRVLGIGVAEEYNFLIKGNCIECEGRDDAKDFSRIRSAMKTLTFSEIQFQEILKLLAAILHLGNVSFEASTQNNLETSDVCKSEHFTFAASLLQVNNSSLATSLTHRTFMTNKERVTKPLNSDQAADCRDAFVKAIYNKLFIWIVGTINNVIYKKVANNRKSFLSIGLLDIFGFENFYTNSFEQLCINFANEKLQQFFVSHIFKLEQEEYLKEDIVWNNIKFSDNQNILDLLAGIPCNLLSLIDEESHFPKGSDVTMLTKMNQQHHENQIYIASKSEHDTDFGINHFAGVVYYNTNGFLEKNRDAVSYDVLKMIDTSTNKLLHQIFESNLSTNGLNVPKNTRIVMTPRSSLRAKTDKRKQLPTLSGQFRMSLDSLMKALSACQPFFIRCFKPNSEKQSEVFDRELCMRQLRYSGMIDTIRIRKLGYPVRHTFKDFLKRYRVLLKTSNCDPKTKRAADCCEAICKAVIKGQDEWKIGRAQIFLREAHDTDLERLREEELSRVAVVIQRVMLGHKDRRSFLQKRRAAVVLQRNWRAYKENKDQRKIQQCFERLVSKVRGRKLQLQFQRQRAASLTIQTQVRGYLARKDWKKKRSAVKRQAYTSGVLAVAAAETMTTDAFLDQMETDEEDEIALELQRRLEEVAAQQHAKEPEPLNDLDSASDLYEITSFVEGVEEETSFKKILRKNKKKLSGIRRVSAITEEPENLTEDEDILVGEGPTLDRPLTTLEKLHVIIGHALSRRGIRDEIYCQICKQLVNNKNRRSSLQGWTLLSICLGIFPPTDFFMKYLENFLRKGQGGYREYCIKRFHRIMANGERKELPCWIELQAAIKREPIDVTVSLTNDRTISLPLDSASTSAEVCQAVADKIGLKDTYGFSLYISLFDKMWSLSSCRKHVLDAVSQCEQEMRRQGNEEKDTPWRLSIRKELFTPWHNCSKDPVSTDLIYKQVIKGVKSGEYTSDKEDDYVQLAAMHHYIQYGRGHNKENVREVVQECITTTLIENKSMTNWIQLITEELKEFHEGHVSGHYVRLTTIRGDFDLKCMEAVDMADLIDSNLNGLMRRSKYAVAQHDFSKPEDPMYLICKRGDLLVTEKDDEYSLDARWIRATNWRSGGSGAVDKSTLQFLPTLSMPTEEMLELLRPRQKKTALSSNLPAEETMAPVSLKEFALEYFRPPGKEGGRQGATRGVNREKLWAYSREPLKQPLLKTVVNNSDLSIQWLPPILKYMGDYPIKHARSPIELTNQIFGPPTKHHDLQDEIYCQIMRQMTSNGNRLSLERGWQLIWLCTGLFPPSPNLRNHAQRFMESRPRETLSAECLQRMQEICCREPRKFPPYQAEVDAIQQNSTQIFYKVHFPNDTDDLFEVTSTTTVKDLRCSIASQLSLTSPEGYGLYVKTLQKMMSLDEQQYFFDNVRQPAEVPKKTKKGKEVIQTNMPSLVMFKRKLWFNVTPGKDHVADLTFHFPQEMPKYLRGLHNCTREDMFHLGGLLFRVAVDSDRSQFVMIPRMLNNLVPADQLQSMSPEEWKKHIISSYNKQSGITVQEAKIAFLRTISSWPTFGCAFYEVKQTCDSSYPNPVLIAISKKGVNLIDPQTKELLVLHEFNRITDYLSEGNFFQMTIRTLVRGIIFVCETTQAHAIEDLIRSYVRMYEGHKQAFRPNNRMFSRGFTRIPTGPF